MAIVLREYSLKNGTKAKVYSYANSDTALMVARQALPLASKTLANTVGSDKKHVTITARAQPSGTQFIPAFEIDPNTIVLIATESTGQRPVLLERDDPKSSNNKTTLSLADGEHDRWKNKEERTMSFLNRPRASFIS